MEARQLFRGVPLLLNEEGILNLFQECDAAWVHDGDPQKPHAELTSGKCSNGFFDCLRVFSYPNLTEILGRQLGKELRSWLGPLGPLKVDWVVSSAYAAITFGHEVSKYLQAQFGFVEKNPEDPNGKKMVWQRTQLPADTRILQIEELITTSQTLREVRRAIQEGNREAVEFLSVVGTLVHRPPKLPADYRDFGIKQVVALIEKEVWAVEPSECPLCKAGSKRLRPKTHWQELTGKK